MIFFIFTEEPVAQDVMQLDPGNGDECSVQNPEADTEHASCSTNDSQSQKQTKASPPKDTPRGWRKRQVTTEIPEYLPHQGNIYCTYIVVEHNEMSYHGIKNLLYFGYYFQVLWKIIL